MTTITARLSRLEAQRQAQMQQAIKDWNAWLAANFDRADADHFWRWVIAPIAQSANPTPDQLEMLAYWGEFIPWRDEMGLSRVVLLMPQVLIPMFGYRGDDLLAYQNDRRRFQTLLRFNLLVALNRAPNTDAAQRLNDWLAANVTVGESVKRWVWFHGLTWPAIVDYVPDVTRPEFEAIARGLPAQPPTDDELIAFHSRPMPNELVDDLADDMGIEAQRPQTRHSGRKLGVTSNRA